jgi:catechol 2,3-dioxygenase-like lactoylglutathione lyase family enzyme
VRPLPFHPLLLGVFPVLFLWAQNAQEAEPSEALPVIGAVLVGVAVLTLVAGLALRDLRRGGLVASVAAVLVLAYGRVLGGASPIVGVGLAAFIVVAVAVLAWRSPGERMASWTSTVNLGATILVVATLVPVVAAAASAAEPPREPPAEPGGETGTDLAGLVLPPDAPDIFYIIPDRYPRQDTLAEVFGYDNTPFLSALGSRGFDVLSRSLANYPKTAHSLATSLNLDYLDELERSVPASAQDSWRPVYSLLRDHELGRLLTGVGYEYVHLGTWWSPTQTAATADVTLNHDLTSEFRRVFTDTTIWPAVQELLAADEDRVEQRVWKRDHTAYQFDELDRLAREEADRPRFVLAHLTIPHEPYVFDADGSFVTQGEEWDRTREDNFVRQVEYANTRLLRFLDELLERADGEGPIVILQSDEGPHPAPRVAEGPSFDWTEASDAVLAEKLRIINAVRLPGAPRGALPETSTPVNTFRFVLSHYLGADLALLPDEAYIFPHEDQLYRFFEVTDRVR